MPPPRPPLPPPRSLPGRWVRAAPPRAGHDGSCSSPPYARRGVARGGRGGGGLRVPAAPATRAHAQLGAGEQKPPLPILSPGAALYSARVREGKQRGLWAHPSAERLRERGRCRRPPFRSASTASGERRGGIGPRGCDAGMESGRGPLFPGYLRGREGCGDIRAMGWERPRARLWGWGGFLFLLCAAGGGGAPRAARPPGSRCGDGEGGHLCAAIACYWLAGGRAYREATAIGCGRRGAWFVCK